MSYLFTGIFTNDNLEISAINDKKFVVKNIAEVSDHKLQYGIFFPELLSKESEQKKEYVLSYFKELRQYGLNKALYMNYVYLGGMPEQIDSFIIENDVIVEDSEVSYIDQPEKKINALFVSIMRAFDVSIDASGYFKAFEKGFWGEENF